MKQPTVDEVLEYARRNRKPVHDEAVVRRQLDAFFAMAQIAISTVYDAAHHGNVRCKNAVFEIEKLKALLK